MNAQATAEAAPPCVMTVDVEDWFHILDDPASPAESEWERLPSRVERNFRRLLEIFAAHKVTTTCFFLGWIAERFPHLVAEAQAGGHEVAAHGYTHALIRSDDPDRFAADAARVKAVLEQISGTPVLGYRAPGFSLPDTDAFYEALIRCGYTYDASLFPGRHGHGGHHGAPLAPHAVTAASGTLREFPVSLTRLLGRRICLFGGGYLRLAPRPLISHAAARVQSEGRPVIFYLHPRDIDPDQPRLPLAPLRRFKSYVNLHTTERKLNALLETFEFRTLAELLPTSAREERR